MKKIVDAFVSSIMLFAYVKKRQTMVEWICRERVTVNGMRLLPGDREVMHMTTLEILTFLMVIIDIINLVINTKQK